MDSDLSNAERVWQMEELISRYADALSGKSFIPGDAPTPDARRRRAHNALTHSLHGLC
jgi:hypothetical protein